MGPAAGRRGVWVEYSQAEQRLIIIDLPYFFARLGVEEMHGQRPNTIPLDLEAELRGIKRHRRHGQHW
jgi:hypothetical protein